MEMSRQEVRLKQPRNREEFLSMANPGINHSVILCLHRSKFVIYIYIYIYIYIAPSIYFSRDNEDSVNNVSSTASSSPSPTTSNKRTRATPSAALDPNELFSKQMALMLERQSERNTEEEKRKQKDER